jgi:RimJ/RimL family protein N-acetyltransferase
MHQTKPRYSTPALTLRRWLPSDRAAFASLNADVEVMKFLGGVIDEERAGALLDQSDRHFADHGFGLWALEQCVTGEFLGCVGLHRPSFEAAFTPCVEIVWRLARHAWGRGYATEAAAEVCRIAFLELGLPEIVSFTVPANQRSRRVMERLGMLRDPVGDFEHPRLPQGHPLRAHVLYRLTRERWAAQGIRRPR